jgi:hypothetical protein
LKGFGKAIYWILIVQLTVPTQFFSYSVPQAQAAEPVQSTSSATASGEPTPLAAASRAATLESFLQSSLRIRSAVETNIPGALTHHMQASQMSFSAVAHCPITLPTEQSPLKLIDESILSAATALFAFMEKRQGQLGKFADNLQGDFVNEPLLKTIYVGDQPCQPQSNYDSPLESKDATAWQLRVKLAVEKNWKDQTSGSPGNLFYKIGYKSEKAPLSNEELDQWLAWLNWLVQFREALATQERLRIGVAVATDAAHVKTTIVPTLKSIEMEPKLGKTVTTVLNQMREQRAYENLKDEDRKRLTPEQITAKKLIQASANVDKIPGFKACGAKFCFIPAKREAAERLAEKVIIALQDPKLGPGAYLDAMVALAKQSSILELTAVNSLLPKRLKLTKLPDTVAASFQDPNQFAAEEFADFVNQFHQLSSVEYRYWWAHQLGLSFQQFVFGLQTRKNPVLLPPPSPHSFPVKSADGKSETKITLYERGNQIVEQFVSEFLNEAERSDLLRADEKERLTKAKPDVLARLKTQSFENYLRTQTGLSTLDDVSTLMGEKLLVLTALIKPNLIDGLSEEEWKNREKLYLPLLREVVTATLADVLAQYALLQLDTPELVQKLPNGMREPLFSGLFQQASILWRERFGVEWTKLVLSDAGADSWEIAKNMHSQLLETEAMKKLKSLSEERGSDAVVEAVVADRVKDSMKLVEEAAKAEETIQYMTELSNWKANPIWNFLPGPTNYFTLEALGAEQGPNAACFNVDNRQAYFWSGGHGTGRNTYGSLAPENTEDYLFMKTSLQSIAQRSLEGVASRLEKRPDIKNILKTYGITGEKALARSIFRRFLQVSEAKPALDPIRSPREREEAKLPLETWLNSGQKARKEYTQSLERLVSRLYRQEIQPLSMAVETAKNNSEKKSWDVYATKSLERINRDLEPVLVTPLDWKKLIDAKNKSPQKELDATLEFVKRIEALSIKVAESKVFEKPENLKDKEATNFIQYCKAHKDECLGWISEIENLLENPAFESLYRARLAVTSTNRVFPSGLENIEKPTSVAKLPAVERAEILRQGWIGKELPGEMFFWVPEVFKNANGQISQPKGNASFMGPFDSFKTSLGGTETNGKVVLNDLGKKVAGLLTPVLGTQIGPRTESVKKNTIAAFDKFMAEISSRPALTRDEFSDLAWEEVQKANLIPAYIAQQKHLTAASRGLIEGQEDVLLEMAYETFKTALVGNLKSATESANLEFLRNRTERPVLAMILDSYLLNFDQFKIKTLNLAARVVSPAMDPREEILEIDKRLRDTRDAVSNIEFDLKGYEDTYIVQRIPDAPLIKTQQTALKRQAEIGREQIQDLEKHKKEAYVRLNAQSELKNLLTLTLSGLPEARKFISLLGSETKDAQGLLTDMHEHYLNAPRIRAKHTLSTAQIIDDLNQLASRQKNYPDVEPKFAKGYLTEVRSYFENGLKEEQVRPYLQSFFQRTLTQWWNTAQAKTTPKNYKKALSDQLIRVVAMWVGTVSWTEKLKSFFHQSTLDKVKAAQAAGKDMEAFSALLPDISADVTPIAKSIQNQAAYLLSEVEKLEKEQGNAAEVFKASPTLRRTYWEFVEFTSHLLFGNQSAFEPIIFENNDGAFSIWIRSLPGGQTLQGEDLVSYTSRALGVSGKTVAEVDQQLAAKLGPSVQSLLMPLFLVVRQPGLTKATFDEIWPPSFLAQFEIKEPSDWTQEGLRTWLMSQKPMQLMYLHGAVANRFATWLHNDLDVPTLALSWQRSSKPAAVVPYKSAHADFTQKLSTLLNLWNEVSGEVRDRGELAEKLAKEKAEKEAADKAAAEKAVADKAAADKAAAELAAKEKEKADAIAAPSTEPVKPVEAAKTAATEKKPETPKIVDPKIPEENPSAVDVLARSTFRLFTHGTQYRYENGNFVLYDKERNRTTEPSDAAFEEILAKKDHKALYRVMNQITGIVLAETQRATLSATEATTNLLSGRESLENLSLDGNLPFYGDISENRPVSAPFYNGNEAVLFDPGVLFMARMTYDFSRSAMAVTPVQLWQLYFSQQMENSDRGLVDTSITFQTSWHPASDVPGAPAAKASEEAKRFVTWFEFLQSSEAAAIFAKLQKENAGDGGERLWNFYKSLDEMKADKDGAYAQVLEFLSKWDANSTAKPIPESYPYLMASLSQHIQLPFEISQPQGKKKILPPEVTSHLLRELLAEMELDIENFQSWKHVFDQKSGPEEWLAMAVAKKQALVETHHRRFLSVLVDAPVTTNPQMGVNYNYRSYPIEFLDIDGKLDSSGLKMATEHKSADWIQMTENADRTALYQTLANDRAQLPLHQVMLGAYLDKQDATEIDALETSLASYKSQVDAAVVKRFTTGEDKEKTPLVASAPVKHDRYSSNQNNWSGYFSSTESKIASPAEFQQVMFAAQQAAGKDNTLTPAQMADLIRKRAAFVALNKAVNELVRGYSFEGWKLKQWRGNDVLNVENITALDPTSLADKTTQLFLTGLQTEVNGLLAAYKSQIGSQHPAKIVLKRSHPEAARREAAGKTIHLAWNLLQATLPKGSGEHFERDAEKVIAGADSYYREQAVVRRYWGGLLAIGKNILENMGELFKERDLRLRIKNEAEFMVEAERIWKLKLPLMDNLAKMMDEFAPTELGDKTRHLLQALVIKDDVERRKREELYQVFYMGAFAGILVGATAPHLVGNIGLLTQQLPWPVPQAAVLSFSVAMGYAFSDNLIHRYREDWVNAPNRVASEGTIRDSHIQAYLMLMKDETAYLRDPSLRAIEATQTGNFYILFRAVDVMVVYGTVVKPIFRIASGITRALYAATRPVVARAFYSRGALKAAEEKLLLAETEAVASKNAQHIGLNDLAATAPNDAQSTIEAAVDKSIASITKGFADQGMGTAEKPLRAVLDRRAQVRMQDIANSAGLELEVAGLPARQGSNMASRLWNGMLQGPKVAEFQDQQRRLITQLRELQTRLRAGEEMSHFTVDDLSILFADETSIYRAYTWAPLRVVGITRPGWLQPRAVRQLRELQIAVQGGMRSQQAISYYFLGKWMNRVKPMLDQLAVATGRSQKEWLERIIQNKNFIKDELTPVRPDNFDYKLMVQECDELRNILNMGNISPTDDLLEAMAMSDSPALLSIFKGVKPQNFLSRGSLALQAPKGIAAPATAVEPTAVNVAEASLAIEGRNLVAQVAKRVTKQEISDFTALETFLREKLPSSVDGIAIDKDAVIELIKTHPSGGIKRMLGEHMRERGMTMTSNTAQLKLAGEYRRAIELDLGIVDDFASVRGGTTVSNRLQAFHDVYLYDARRILSTNAETLSLQESQGYFGLKASPKWTQADLEFAKAEFQAADSVATDQIGQKLERFSFANRASNRLQTHAELAELYDMPVEYFQVKGIDGVLKKFTDAKVLLHRSEQVFLGKGLGSTPIYDATDAADILGLTFRAGKMPTAADIHKRADLLYTEMELAYGSNAPSILGSKLPPTYVDYGPLEKIRIAERTLINAVTQ